MTGGDAQSATFFEQFAVFRYNAGELSISIEEQLAVLNIDYEAYRALILGDHDRLKPEIARRLSYALSFMRRLTREGLSSEKPTSRECVFA